MVERSQTLAGISVALACLLLVTASLFLDDWRKAQTACKKIADIFGELQGGCRKPAFFVSGASLGIIAAVIHILSSALGFLKKTKLWLSMQIVAVFFAVIGLTLTIIEKGYDIRSDKDSYPGSPGLIDAVTVSGFRGFAFVVALSLDILFVLVAVAVIYCNCCSCCGGSELRAKSWSSGAFQAVPT